MENEKLNTNQQSLFGGTIIFNQGTGMKCVVPLEMRWKPKEDITVYELAKCLPFLIRTIVMPYEVDKSENHFRHFEIIDHNN